MISTSGPRFLIGLTIACSIGLANAAPVTRLTRYVASTVFSFVVGRATRTAMTTGVGNICLGFHSSRSKTQSRFCVEHSLTSLVQKE